MRRFWVLRGLRMLAFIVVALAVFGYIVMRLWNWVLPPLTGWQQIAFGPAVGLLVLSRILFGGIRGFRGGGHWRHRMQERFAPLSPEERERFRQRLQRRCASNAAPESSATPVDPSR